MHVKWKEVDPRGWAREESYRAFRACDFPYLVVGSNLSLGNARERWKASGVSSFLACVHAFCAAANEVAAFRLRIRGDKLIEHETIHADYTVPGAIAPEESFTIRKVGFDPDYDRFVENTERASGGFTFADELVHDDHWLYMSCLPWIQLTHVVQPIKALGPDSIPRLIWGKFFQEGGEWKIPVSVQVHHALVDGIHIARFFAAAERRFAQK